MKLNQSDREILLHMGVPPEDFDQIERAATGGKTIYSSQGKRIGQKEAVRILGRKEYLSGISRSAFHYTAVRIASDGTEVYFDSTPFFRGSTVSAP